MLEIQNLHVKFHNRDREAVSGVSLTIQDGEILGLVGESGSGKSVTAMSVAGLLPRKRCDYTGRILLDGQELLHADRSVLREIQGAEIGVVFQEPQSCMDPLMRIGPQVEEVLRIHTDLSREARRDQALAALFAREGRPTAVLVSDDILAVALEKACIGLGLSIPGDVSILSFNNSLLARLTFPPLTSVDVNACQLGIEAAAQMISHVENPELVATKIIVPHHLVERESCAGTGRLCGDWDTETI